MGHPKQALHICQSQRERVMQICRVIVRWLACCHVTFSVQSTYSYQSAVHGHTPYCEQRSAAPLPDRMHIVNMHVFIVIYPSLLVLYNNTKAPYNKQPSTMLSPSRFLHMVVKLSKYPNFVGIFPIFPDLSWFS